MYLFLLIFLRNLLVDLTDTQRCLTPVPRSHIHQSVENEPKETNLVCFFQYVCFFGIFLGLTPRSHARAHTHTHTNSKMFNACPTILYMYTPNQELRHIILLFPDEATEKTDEKNAIFNFVYC